MPVLTYFTTLHQFHDEKEVLFILIDVVKLDNVWMIDLLQYIDLILQANFILISQFSPFIKTSIICK